MFEFSQKGYGGSAVPGFILLFLPLIVVVMEEYRLRKTQRVAGNSPSPVPTPMATPSLPPSSFGTPSITAPVNHCSYSA